MDTSTAPHWVLIKKLSAETGYSEDAIRAKKKNNVWKMNVHWKKAPDNHVIFNATAVQRWMIDSVKK